MTKNTKELIRYIFFGAITVGINILLLKIFIDLGVYYILSNIISYFIAVVINYIFNKYYVFKNFETKKTKVINKQFLKFIGMRMISLILDNFLFYICVSILQYPIYLSRIVLTIIIIALTFIINKFFIFVNK